MKISRNSKLKSILFIGFLIAIFAPIGKSDAIILVRVNAPAFATVNSPISITASTYYSTDYIGIYVDGSVIKECTGFVNSCSSTFVTSSSIKNHKIQAYADNYGFATTYTRLRFSIPSGSDSIFGISYSTWYSNARDFARSPDSSTVWDRAYKILQTYNNGQGIYNSLNAITAISNYASSILVQHYASDLDSLTAQESANYIDSTTLIPSRTFDCSDMAAFISGIGEVLGIPSRMVSLSYTSGKPDPGYQHMFAELYGKTVQSSNGVYNNGWFLIDPGHPNGQFYDSYSNTNTVNSIYSHNSHAYRFWIVWGSDSSHWGQNVGTYTDDATSWVIFQWCGNLSCNSFYYSASSMIYSSNPWGITSDN